MSYQVVVVGAGPGGSTAAHFLARSGIEVLLLDKKRFPRDKACGDGQVRSIQPLFKEMGIYEAIRAQARILRGASFGSPSGAYHSFATPDREIFCTPRIVIDDIIRRSAVERGAHFRDCFTVGELVTARGRVTGLRGREEGRNIEISCEAVVVADGARSRLAAQLGFGTAGPEHLFLGVRAYFDDVQGLSDTMEFIYPDPLFFPGGYLWIFPVTDSRANVGVFISTGALRRSGRSLKSLIPWSVERSAIVKARLREARQASPLKGSILPTYPSAGDNYAAGAVVVGDAGSMVEPLFGSGLPQAMTAGQIAAEVITRALSKGDVSAESLSPYKQRINETMGPAYALSATVRKHLFSDPKDLEAYLAEVNRGDDPVLLNRGANETMVHYLKKYKGVQIA
ncbi:MAG: NAD(P)/FAD-dependent oxidoreductase [Deltaproteobacteria bacterium]|nr:NAD(P)/FAD-dependent oxidoreductase [Deltaproteobacteria bacterium]